MGAAGVAETCAVGVVEPGVTGVAGMGVIGIAMSTAISASSRISVVRGTNMQNNKRLH